MNKKSMVQWLLIAASIIIVLTGCSNGKPPKEAIQAAMDKSMDMKSYTFTGSLGIDELNVPAELLQGQNPAMLDMIKSSSITVNGMYQADPMQMEMTMDIAIKGDMAFTLSIPMVITPDKLWVKIPQIPGVPLGDAAGKFVEIDIKKLTEEQGIKAPTLDINTQRKMAEDMYGILIDHFDEKQYFSEPKAADVKGMPEGLKPDQIVKFAVTQETFDPAVVTIVNEVAPKIIDLLLNNEEYRNSLQLKKEDLEKAKTELAEGDQSKLHQQIDAFKKDVKVNELSMTGAIKDGYMVYQEGKVNVDVTQNNQQIKVGLHVNGQYDNINKPVEFKIGKPTDAIPIEELQSMFTAPAL